MVSLRDLESYAKQYVSGLVSEAKQPHIKLDDVELLKRTDKKGAVKEIRSIYSLAVFGGRNIIELPIPGSVGNVFQDMGRAPLVIKFEGLLVGPESMDTLKSIKEKFETGNSIAFSSNIGLLDQIDKVIITNLSVFFEGGVNLGVRYSMSLKEYAFSDKGKKEKEAPSLIDKAVDAVADKISKAALDKLSV
jgi:hypothetical protein